MTTCATLADEAQNALADAGAGTWSQAQIEEWCRAAIRDYSQHFSRRLSSSLNCSADDRSYDLPAGFQSMLSVEYPAGEDPPEYLARRDRRHPGFWGHAGYYDVIPRCAADDADELWISEKPADTETIVVHYLGDHDYALDSADTLTVPGSHEGILIAHVILLAFRERLAAEVASSYPNLEQMDRLREATRQAAAGYRAWLRDAGNEAGEGGPAIRWQMDEHDRVY